jgi:hypothetical protein
MTRTTFAATRASSFAEGRSPVHGTRQLLLSSIVVTFLAASSAPTPLYQRYNHLWHATALTTTVAFGIYALGVLAGLFSLGELSNHIGR